MRRKPSRKKRILRDLVWQRARILYEHAVEEARKGSLDYAARLGSLIRELSESTGVRLPRSIKRGLCKNCNIPLIPGLTATYRLRSQGRLSYIVIRCERCGWIHRRPYKRGAGFGEVKGESEEGAPRASRRADRKEGDNKRGARGDR